MAIDLSTLMDEGKCLCGAGGSTSERVIMALLQRIAEAGGGGATPGGPLNAVQFNSPLGTLGGSADLTFNDATNLLTVVGNVDATRVLVGTGTEALPSLAFSGDPDTGFYNQAANRIGISLQGVIWWLLIAGEFRQHASDFIGWSSGTPLAAGSDTALGRQAAGIVQVHNGTLGTLRDISVRDIFTNDAASMVRTATTLTNFAGAGAGTLTNAPTAGNPTKWVAIIDNGTTRYIPTWV